MDTESCKNEFRQIYSECIKREGCDKLWEYLSNSDFFVAPASAKFHMAEISGLCQHSINVYHRLVALVKGDLGENYTETYSAETLAIVGLLHDVCKVNFYAVDYKNVKEDNTWVKKPYFKVDERFPFGHGEKSVFIISQFIRLTAEEAMAINWHMGGFDDRVRGGNYSISEAYAKYKLALYAHAADLLATYIDEERGSKLQ